MSKSVCKICKGVVNGTDDAQAGFCASCSELPIYDAIKDAAMKDTESKDPMAFLMNLACHRNMKMHSPVHHFLVPVALLTAYYNLTGNQKDKAEKIMEAEVRSKNVLGGFCGNYGNCGAAVGVGIFYSLINNVKPVTADEGWKDANLVTAKCLEKIALAGGPRCCKAVSYLALKEACDFMRDKGIDYEISSPSQCQYSQSNADCKKERCAFN